MDFKQLEKSIKAGKMPARLLFNKAHLPSDGLFHCVNDSFNYPFYYYIGEIYDGKNVIDCTMELGLHGLAYIRSKKIENYLALEESKNSRFGVSNIKEYHKGNFLICSNVDNFKDVLSKREWDIGFINSNITYDKCKFYLNLLWLNLKEGGLIILDRLCEKEIARCYGDFCDLHKCTSNIFKTSYKSAVIVKG